MPSDAVPQPETPTHADRSAATRAAKRLHTAEMIGRSRIYEVADLIATAISDDRVTPHNGPDPAPPPQAQAGGEGHRPLNLKLDREWAIKQAIEADECGGMVSAGVEQPKNVCVMCGRDCSFLAYCEGMCLQCGDILAAKPYEAVKAFAATYKELAAARAERDTAKSALIGMDTQGREYERLLRAERDAARAERDKARSADSAAEEERA